MSRPTRALVARAAALTLLTALAATSLTLALAHACEERIAPAHAALLFGATSLLGAVWALRQRLDPEPTGSASASAALVPIGGLLFFLAPRLFTGSPSALLTLGSPLVLAPLVERAWSRWIGPGEGAPPELRAALAAAPLAGLALATAQPLLLAGGVVAAAFIAALAAASVRSAAREERAVCAYLRRTEVHPDRVVSPAAPALREPSLRALHGSLERSAAELVRDAAIDATARVEIADARAMRSRFMAVMSHELRSPLNSIMGFSLVLERGMDGTLTEGQRESAQMIHRSAEELMTLLVDVLDLAQLEAGRLVLQRAWTPSVEILTESVTRGRALVHGREVEIEAELQPGLPPVYVDARRILQAVVALFRNAASSLRRTTIRLRARVASGPPGPVRHVRVEIHDAIGAIPAAEVEKIFEAFQEITEPTGRRLGGLGMALTLSRGLVRLHGGEVWAEAAPGMGTVLCIAIPLDEGTPRQ